MTEERKIHTIYKTDDCKSGYIEWMKDQIEDTDNWPVRVGWEGLAYYERTTWKDMIANLNEEVGTIVVMATLGRWNGPNSVYKITKHTNIGQAIDDHKWCDGHRHVYVDGDKLMTTYSHHDGTNVLEFRVLKSEDWSHDDLYETAWSAKRLMEETRPLGKDVCEIFGWEC